MIGYKASKMLEKLSEKIAACIGGHAILKIIHSLHFMIVNRRMDPGRLKILAR
jgi:hypothetical protein